MARLAEELARIRAQKGLSQANVAQKAGLNPSIVSRIETGRIEFPTEDTIRKIAIGLDEPAAVLLQLVQELRIGRTQEVLRIGFAHTIWSAPVIPVVMDGSLDDIRFTSFEIEGDNEPCWQAIRGPERSRLCKMSGCFDSDIPSGIDFIESTLARPFNAVSLKNLLLEKAIDCAIVAGDLFKGLEGTTVRCAQITHTFGGCTALAISSSRFFENQGISEPFSLRALRGVQGNDKIPTIYPARTIAERYLDLVRATRGFDLLIKPVEVDLSRWSAVVEQVQYQLKSSGVVLFLGWEPQVEWLRNDLRTDCEFREVAIGLDLANVKEPVPYHTFDIVIRRSSSIMSAFSPGAAFHTFLSQTNQAIQEISAAAEAADMDARVINRIALYLDMSAGRCCSQLSQMSLGLRYYPEWLEHIQGR